MNIQHCDHTYVEEYYGHRCTECGVFFPHGGAPWDIPLDDDNWEDDDGIRDEWDDEPEFDCGWVPGMGCTKAGSEECDWECPNRRNYEKGMALTQARLAKRAAHNAGGGG